MKCAGLPGSSGDIGGVAVNATALDAGHAEDRAEDRALTGEAARIQDEGGVGAKTESAIASRPMKGADHKPPRRAARAHWRRLLAFV